MENIWFDHMSNMICVEPDKDDEPQKSISLDKIIDETCECIIETVETDLDSKDEMIESVDDVIQKLKECIDKFETCKKIITESSEMVLINL